jgi:hypothetical protein
MSVRRLSLLVAALAALAVGCKKSESKKVDFFAQPPRVDYGSGGTPQPMPEIDAGPVVADSWALKVKAQVRDIHADMQKCRNEYLIPFRFDKMKLRHMDFINISEMEAICVKGDPSVKKRGVYDLVRLLAEESGKNTTLDRYIALSMDTLEHVKTFVWMCQKVGAPEIAKVTDVAKEGRDRAMTVGAQLDALATEIEAWPDAMPPDDDPQALAKPLDLKAFQQQLGQHEGWFVADLTAAYDRFAAKSWESPNLPKLPALKTWLDTPGKRLALDRARLSHVTGADDKQKAELTAYLDAVDKALTAARNGIPRYEKRGVEMDAKDPNRKAVEQAQAAVAKLSKGWGLDAGKP